MTTRTFYRTAAVNGRKIFCGEAGDLNSSGSTAANSCSTKTRRRSLPKSEPYSAYERSLRFGRPWSPLRQPACRFRRTFP